MAASHIEEYLQDYCDTHDGRLDPAEIEGVVSEEGAGNPLFSRLEWDGVEGSRLYRVEQIRRIIRTCTIKLPVADPDQLLGAAPVFAKVKRFVQEPDGTGGYIPVKGLVTDEVRQRQVLNSLVLRARNLRTEILTYCRVWNTKPIHWLAVAEAIEASVEEDQAA